MFEDESVPVEFACMGFRDYKADPSTAFEMTDFYEDHTRLVSWLNNVRSFGGGSNLENPPSRPWCTVSKRLIGQM